MVWRRSLKAEKYRFDPCRPSSAITKADYTPVAQLAEAAISKIVLCEFKSHQEYQIFTKFLIALVAELVYAADLKFV